MNLDQINVGVIVGNEESPNVSQSNFAKNLNSYLIAHSKPSCIKCGSITTLQHL